MTNSDPKHAALTFLRTCPFGFVATISPEGGPRARSVYYVVDDSFAIYFLTLSSTRKFMDLEREERVAFVASSEGPAQTVQIEGDIEDLTQRAVITDPMFRELSEKMILRGLITNPLSHLDPGTIRYYKIVPRFVRWGDFSQGFGESAVFTQII